MTFGKKQFDNVESIIERYNQFLQTKLFKEDVLEKCKNEFMEINKPIIQRTARKKFITTMQNIAKRVKKKKR